MVSTQTFLQLHNSCRTRTDFELCFRPCWKSCYWQRDLKMATSPTELPPPPLFRSQSIQVSRQWSQPTFLQPAMADLGVYIPEHGSQNNRTLYLLLHFLRERCRAWMLFVKPVHRSVNINPISVIYVMLSFPAVPTYLTSHFKAA